MQSSKLKQVIDHFTPYSMSEGVGVRVMRIIGTSKLKTMDPFLMLGKAFFLAKINRQTTLTFAYQGAFPTTRTEASRQ